MVPSVESRMPIAVIVGDLGRGDVIAAAPELRLQLAEGERGLVLVEALQGSIVPLIQAPMLDMRDPHLIYFLRYDVVGEDRPI